MKIFYIVMRLLLLVVWFKSCPSQKTEEKYSTNQIVNPQIEPIISKRISKTSKYSIAAEDSQNQAQDEVKMTADESKIGKPSEESFPESVHAQKKTPEQLAEEKLKIPIAEELKKAISFTTWHSSEIFFTGLYRGQTEIKGKKYVIRINLMFDGTNNDLTPTTCVAIYSPEKTIFQEVYGNQKITFFRTKDTKYIILSVSNRFYFQIFQTMSGNRRSFRTHLTIDGEKRPFVFNLVELSRPDSLDECDNIQP